MKYINYTVLSFINEKQINLMIAKRICPTSWLLTRVYVYKEFAWEDQSEKQYYICQIELVMLNGSILSSYRTAAKVNMPFKLLVYP